MTKKNNDKLDLIKVDNYNKFTSESGHWYDQDGEPMYTIIGANGRERNTTLRDAKTLGFNHPETKKWMSFNSNLPNGFKKMLSLLENLSG